MFERLNAEQENVLRLVRRLDRKEGNWEAIRASDEHAPEALDFLFSGGYVCRYEFGPLDSFGNPSKVCLALTSRGRMYWKERRRWRVITYFPVVLSGLLGILGTVIGVLLERYL